MTRCLFMVGAVVIASWAVAGCGDSAESSAAVSEPASGSDAEFCESMEHLINLLAPSGPTSPSDTEAAFTEAAGWFSGFNLDVVFSTTEGRDLAIATSHTLTVPIVDYTTTECGLSFGNES